jgi:DNA-directed RNA polymerase subunit RPC12/RpoP
MQVENQSHRYWAVVCLRCKKPIPLYAEPAGSDTESQLSGSTAVAQMEPGVLLVWCSNCGKEYPYSTGDIVNYSGPRPPLSLRFHPVFARGQGRRANSRAARG